MKSLIKKNLIEAVGVPTGIHEGAVKIYDFLLEILETIQDPVGEEYNDYIKTDIRINEFNIPEVDMTIKFYETNQVNRVTILGMTISHRTRTEDGYLVPVHDGITKIIFEIAIPSNTTIETIKKRLKRDKVEITSSFGHELKHAYDHFKQEKQSIYSYAKYQSYAQINFGIPSIRRFTFLLYYTTNIENLVRPSELFTRMKESNISYNEFYNFITSTEVWKNLKEISQWTYEGFRENLKRDMRRIKKLFRDNNIEISQNDEEVIDEVLRLLYVNLSNSQMNSVKDLLSTSPFMMFFGVAPDTKTFLKIRKQVLKFENNPLDFYKYEEKKFHQISIDLMKKISKLYSLVNEKKENGTI